MSVGGGGAGGNNIFQSYPAPIIILDDPESDCDEEDFDEYEDDFHSHYNKRNKTRTKTYKKLAEEFMEDITKKDFKKEEKGGLNIKTLIDKYYNLVFGLKDGDVKKFYEKLKSINNENGTADEKDYEDLKAIFFQLPEGEVVEHERSEGAPEEITDLHKFKNSGEDVISNFLGSAQSFGQRKKRSPKLRSKLSTKKSKKKRSKSLKKARKKSSKR